MVGYMKIRIYTSFPSISAGYRYVGNIIKYPLQRYPFMNDSVKMVLGIIVSMVLIFVDSILLIYADISMFVFWIILAAAIGIVFLPIVFFNKSEIGLTGSSLKVKAPFVDLDIPYSDIQGIEFRESFKPGIRVWGYGAVHRGAGQFDNKELGTYTYSGDSRIPAFIVVRYGGNQTLVFNTEDEAQTRSMFEALSSSSGRSGSVPYAGPVPSRSHRNTVVAISVIAVVAAVLIAAFAFTGMGHVNATLEGDHLHVDAMMVDENIPYADITSMELRDSLDYGSRMAGYGGTDYLSGKFRNAEFGDYRLAVHKNVSECIVVHHSGGVLVFNLGSSAETEAFLSHLFSSL